MESKKGFARPVEESREPVSIKKRAPFVDKKTMSRIYLRFLPTLEGYVDEKIAYHIETAVIKIKGKERTWKVRAKCHGRTCPKCIENRSIYGSEKNTPYEKKSHTGHFFMAFQVYPNKADGTFDYGQNKELFLFEYKYRWVNKKTQDGRDNFKLVADDWMNLLDAFDVASAKGDPTDPVTGTVFSVDYKKVPAGPSLQNLKDTFTHEAQLGKTAPLPENWKEIVESHYSIANSYMDLSGADLKILVETAAAIESVVQDASLRTEERQKKADDLYANYHRIGNADFKSILESMEKRQDSAGSFQGQADGMAAEFSAHAQGGYARQSDLSLAVSPAVSPTVSSVSSHEAHAKEPSVTEALEIRGGEPEAASPAAVAPISEKLKSLQSRMRREKAGSGG